MKTIYTMKDIPYLNTIIKYFLKAYYNEDTAQDTLLLILRYLKQNQYISIHNVQILANRIRRKAITENNRKKLTTSLDEQLEINPHINTHKIVGYLTNTSIVVACRNCRKEFKQKSCIIVKYRNSYCSMECRDVYLKGYKNRSQYNIRLLAKREKLKTQLQSILETEYAD